MESWIEISAFVKRKIFGRRLEPRIEWDFRVDQSSERNMMIKNVDLETSATLERRIQKKKRSTRA